MGPLKEPCHVLVVLYCTRYYCNAINTEFSVMFIFF